MNETESELVHQERSSIGPVIVIGLIFLPVLYVLSPPFLIPLFVPGREHLYLTFYAPLVYLTQEFTFVEEFYNWYGSLFPWL